MPRKTGLLEWTGIYVIQQPSRPPPHRTPRIPTAVGQLRMLGITKYTNDLPNRYQRRKEKHRLLSLSLSLSLSLPSHLHSFFFPPYCTSNIWFDLLYFISCSTFSPLPRCGGGRTGEAKEQGWGPPTYPKRHPARCECPPSCRFPIGKVHGGP